MNRDGLRVAKTMEWVAWISVAVGTLFFLFHASEFSDTNLGLMVSMGIVIAGMMIYGVGTFVHLLDRDTSKE